VPDANLDIVAPQLSNFANAIWDSWSNTASQNQD
jgi:hypothetical protein